MQVLDRRPGDGEAVEGRSAAADFVENNQGTRPGAVQNRSGFNHFNHEGRAAPREVVRGADAEKQPVDDANSGALGRRTAHLRQQHDHRVLAQER